MYNSNDRKFMNLNSYLQEVYSGDLESIERYKTLTEEEKKDTAKNIITKLFNTIKNKTLHIDYHSIEITKGDFTKFEKYDDVKNSINFLQSMYQNDSENAPDEIPSLKRCLDLILKYKNEFQEGFNKKQETKILLYNNIVSALIGATAFLISVSITYMKTPDGSFKAIFKASSKKAVEGDLYFKNIDKFISMDMNGKLKVFFGNGDVVKESTSAISNYRKKGVYYSEGVGAVIGITFTAIMVVILVLLLIKELVFKFFELRTQISDRLIQIAYFVECNAKNLDPNVGNNKQIIEKQRKMVEKINHLAEKIAVDNRIADKTAKEDNDKDTKKTEEESKQTEGDILI